MIIEIIDRIKKGIKINGNTSNMLFICQGKAKEVTQLRFHINGISQKEASSIPRLYILIR